MQRPGRLASAEVSRVVSRVALYLCFVRVSNNPNDLRLAAVQQSSSLLVAPFTVDTTPQRVASALVDLRRANLSVIIDTMLDPETRILSAWVVRYLAAPSPVKGIPLRRASFGLLRYKAYGLAQAVALAQPMASSPSPPDEQFLRAVACIARAFFWGGFGGGVLTPPAQRSERPMYAGPPGVRPDVPPASL